MTCLRSHSKQVAELGSEPHLPISNSWTEKARVSLQYEFGEERYRTMGEKEWDFYPVDPTQIPGHAPSLPSRCHMSYFLRTDVCWPTDPPQALPIHFTTFKLHF